MADNVTLNSGSGGETLATDDIGGVQHQRVKIQHGADGSATDVSTASPLPVDLRADNLAGNLDVNLAASSVTVTVDGSGVTQPVSNTNIDNLHSTDFDSGAGTDTTPAIGLAVPASGGAAVIPGDAIAGLKVDLGVDNDVTVTGTVTANAGTGTFTVDGSAVTQPVSAASLPLPTGAATSSNQTTANTSLGNIDTNTAGLPGVIGTDGSAGPASAVSMAGTETGGTLQELRVDSDGHLQIDVLSGGGASIQYLEGATDASITGTALMMEDAADTLRAATGTVANGLDVDVTRVQGTVTVDGSGVTQPVSGTVTANAGTGTFTVDGSGVTQPVSGTVTANAGTGTFTVDGSAVTQPISNAAVDNLHSSDFDTGAGTDTTSSIGIAVASSGGAAVITGDVTNGLDVDVTRVSGTVTVDGSGVTQPISAASLPLPTGAATSANQSTGNTTLSNIRTAVQIIDNTIFADDAAFTLGTSSVNVAGAIRDDALTTLTAVEGDAVPLRVGSTGALHVAIEGTATVDGSAVTQPVSAVSLPLPTGAATAANQSTANTSLSNIDTNTTGIPGVIGTDGTAGPASAISVAGTESGGTLQELRVDSDGHLQIDVLSGGGGTQYTEAATDASITGTALMFEDAADTLRAATGTTANGLDVDVTRVQGTVTVDGSGVTQPVSGTVTANAGTGTFTVDGSGVTQPISAASLPLPTGAATAANQSTANTSLSNIETAVQVIDNAIFADDAAFTLGSSSVDVAGAIRDDSLTTLTAVEGDAVPLRVSANGALHVTGGGGGTEYVEDAAAPADPTGTVAVFVRDDVPVSHAADGDWVAQRGTQYGAGCVQVVTSTGSFVDSFGGSGGTSHADDAAFTIGSASSITPTGYLADETTPDSVDEGDVGVPRMTLNRKAYAVLADPTAENSAGVDASGHLQVDIAADSAGLATQATVTDIETNTDSLAVIGGGAEAGALRVTLANDSTGLVSVDDGGASLTVDNGGTFAVQAAVDELPAAAALADAAANPTTTTVGAGMLMYNGVTWDRVRGTTANGLDVDVTASVLPTGAATQATLSDVETNTDSLAVTGNGTAAGAVRVTVASDTTGVLSVDDNGASLTVDNGGVFAVQEDGAALTALQLIDDAIYADDAAFTLTTSKVAAVGAIRDDALTTLTAVENDVVPLRVGSTGALHVDGSGATQPVSGTITANLSATDNAVLDQIDSNTDYGAVTGGGVEAGALRVTLASDSTGQITVNGTVTANAGTGTMTVDTELPAAAALADAAGNPTTSIAGSALLQFNGTTWDRARGDTTNGIDVDVTRVSGTVTVDGSGVTQPVSNAGTFSTQVDGDALTALQLIDDIVYTDDTSTHATGTSKGALIMGAATPTDGTVEANDIGAVAMSTDRRLLVDAQLAGSDITLNVDGSGATQPVSGTVTANLSATDNAVLDQIEVNTSYGDNLGNGTAAGSLRVSLASDSTGQVTVTGSLPAGTNNIGDVDIASALPAGTNLVGDVGLSGARTSGGTTPHYNNGTATETQIKGSAGQIYWIHAMNLRSTVAYLQLFNGTSATFIPGTTTPTNEFVIATQGDTNGAGFTLSIPNGLAYGSGITYFISTTKGGGVAVSADEVLLNLGYA